jgi:TRAP-type transport system small permease protein
MEAPLNRADALLRACCRSIEILIALALAAMVLMVFGNVVLRYAFNSGITVSEELSRWAFVWLTFLGAVVGLQERAHLGTTVLTSRFGPAGRRVCLVLSQGLMLALTAAIFHGSWVQTRINLDVEAPVSGFSMGWVYGAGCVFAALGGATLALDLWRTLVGGGAQSPEGAA